MSKYKITKIQLNRPNGLICPHCRYAFTKRANLKRHINNQSCMEARFGQAVKQIKEQLTSKIKEETVKVKEEINGKHTVDAERMNELENQVKELKNKPLINNQILQVVCIGQNDNYLDMLTEKWDFNRALDFIKGCALSSLAGDCKLIEKIYNESSDQCVMHYVDKGRTKIEYYNENKEKVIDNKELFGRKLANNLQNSYLKGVNYLTKKTLEERGCPNKFLEEYDLQTWNSHIYELSDIRYQRKIIGHLEIPLK